MKYRVKDCNQTYEKDTIKIEFKRSCSFGRYCLYCFDDCSRSHRIKQERSGMNEELSKTINLNGSIFYHSGDDDLCNRTRLLERYQGDVREAN
jgi:hypothetical protein